MHLGVQFQDTTDVVDDHLGPPEFGMVRVHQAQEFGHPVWWKATVATHLDHKEVTVLALKANLENQTSLQVTVVPPRFYQDVPIRIGVEVPILP